MIDMKGSELPISTLIIIVIALIVLLAVVAIFFGPYNITKYGAELETARTNACNMLQGMNCIPNPWEVQISNFDANKDGVNNGGTENVAPGSCGVAPVGNDNLARLCLCYYNIPPGNLANDCNEKVCRCPE